MKLRWPTSKRNLGRFPWQPPTDSSASSSTAPTSTAASPPTWAWSSWCRLWDSSVFVSATTTKARSNGSANTASTTPDSTSRSAPSRVRLRQECTAWSTPEDLLEFERREGNHLHLSPPRLILLDDAAAELEELFLRLVRVCPRRTKVLSRNVEVQSLHRFRRSGPRGPRQPHL